MKDKVPMAPCVCAVLLVGLSACTKLGSGEQVQTEVYSPGQNTFSAKDGVSSVSGVSNANVFRYVDGFSDSQKRNGWGYRYRNLAGVLGSMSWDSATGQWQGDEKYLLAWRGGVHPGERSDAVLEWTAPENGLAKITGTVRVLSNKCGDGVAVTIEHNGLVLWSETVDNGDASGKKFVFDRVLRSGESLLFVVSKKANNGCDSTNFDPAITFQPSPLSERSELSPSQTNRFGVALVGNFPAWNGWGWGEETFLRYLYADGKIASEIATAASLGMKHVKIVVAPHFSGLNFGKPDGSRLDFVVIDAIRKRLLPLILRELRAYGMDAYVDFLGHEWYLDGPKGWSTPPSYYEDQYRQLGALEAGKQLGRDISSWAGAIMEGVEASPERDVVAEWQVFPEVPDHKGDEYRAVSAEILRQIYANVPVGRAAKLVTGPLSESGLPWYAGILKSFNWSPKSTFLSIYPSADASGGLNANIETAIGKIREMFPQSRATIDYGVPFCSSKNEADQASRIAFNLGTFEKVRAEAVLQWGLWDYDDSEQCGKGKDSSRFGFGYSLAKPRDALGVVLDKYSLVPNGDFEAPLNDWSASPNTSISSRIGAANEAATGKRFLHVEANGAAAVYACSPQFALKGNRVALNAYFRSASPISISLLSRNAVGEFVNVRSFRFPESSNFVAIQSQKPGFVFDVPAGTNVAKICFSGVQGVSHSFFDVDALSIGVFEGTGIGTLMQLVDSGISGVEPTVLSSGAEKPTSDPASASVVTLDCTDSSLKIPSSAQYVRMLVGVHRIGNNRFLYSNGSPGGFCLYDGNNWDKTFPKDQYPNPMSMPAESCFPLDRYRLEIGPCGE
jgi:hypothetical protein